MNFKKHFEEFSVERKNSFRQKVNRESKYYEIVMQSMRNDLENFIKQDNLIVKPSVGQGFYADVPWICILSDNPRISPSAQKGIYIVLLFSTTGDSFYLSLSQGVTNFKNRERTSTKRNVLIQKTVDYFQSELPSVFLEKLGFSFEQMNLGSELSSLAKGYLKTTIISKKFNVDDFKENEFYSSLQALINEYNEIVDYIGVKSYDDVIEAISPSESVMFSDVALEEISNILKEEYAETRDLTIKPIEVKKGNKRDNKYHKISQPKIYKKTDYLAKAKDDHVTGLKGEDIALKIERKRVQELNLDPDKYIKYIADASDSFGYDIQSIDIINGKEVPVFIEVKTTKSIKDTDFFVSKNELETSKTKGDNYRVLRIFDVMSKNPKYYVAKGKIDDNFYLDPVTYSARYMFEVNLEMN